MVMEGSLGLVREVGVVGLALLSILLLCLSPASLGTLTNALCLRAGLSLDRLPSLLCRPIAAFCLMSN